ncbi:MULTISPECIES: lipid II-degrading bacteriocin [unclassified Pseudomonas]|uniref:lipid II-degrading bacteriocin n=1 Tax=unclassified Pseudomonas TaxID=196821 RepID=UPI0025D44FB6|nr:MULTISPECIES: lipid II-degrading bacteriocin [unclassified Pseudomonas]
MADKFMCVHPHALSTEAVRQAVSRWGYGKKIADVRELSGGVLSAFAAYGHYFKGGGEEVVTNINRLGLSISGKSIPVLESVFAAAHIGRSPVNLPKVPYSTWDSSWITGTWLGNITLNVQGVVHQYHDGRLSFSRVSSAYNDTFDFNASTQRAAIGKVATRVVRELVKVMRPQPYQIVIQGKLPISINR